VSTSGYGYLTVGLRQKFVLIATIVTSNKPAAYLIVGSGIFGASSAFHLIKKHLNARVCLVDRLAYLRPLAASCYWNKVVRADYGDAFYMKLVLDGIKLGREDSIFKPYFHESGMINIDNTGLGRRTIANYQALETDVKPELVSSNE
jgi:sarcosine oxidase / L-pipecolate oxidase